MAFEYLAAMGIAVLVAQFHLHAAVRYSRHDTR